MIGAARPTRVRQAGRPPATSGWLGLHAANPKVRTSGLRNSNHVDDNYQPSFLNDMAACLKAIR